MEEDPGLQKTKQMQIVIYMNTALVNIFSHSTIMSLLNKYKNNIKICGMYTYSYKGYVQYLLKNIFKFFSDCHSIH